MNLSLEQIARALDGVVTKKGQVLAPGPGHSPVDRSLSVLLDASTEDGFVVNSFSTADAVDPIALKDYVRSRLGLPAWKPNNGHGGARRRASPDAIHKAVLGAVTQQSYDAAPTGKVVAMYRYTDAQGNLLYEVLRYFPKDFRQRRPDGNGGWVWKLDDRRVLYRLPELMQFPDATVFVCEGEKDADRVASLDLCATTVAAGIWTQECVAALADRDVVILADTDTAGEVKARETAIRLHGTAKTIRVVNLPGLTADHGNNDVSDWLDANPGRASTLADICLDAPLWKPADNTSSATSDTATTTAAADQKAAPAPLPFINLATWRDAPAPDREWVATDRVPLKSVTLLSGDGGVGKSIIALQLCVATVIGRDWLGTMPAAGPAMVLACEDDQDELHRRLDRIVEHYQVTYENLSALHLLSFAGTDAVLGAPDSRSRIEPTQLYNRLHHAARDIRPRLIVIDNAADAFAGNENDRAQVRQFVTLLRGMAIDAGAGLVLTSHPSLTGMSSGTGLSGSTAWNASVRSRLYFKRATPDKDEQADPDLRTLEVVKANYGPVGESINLRWQNGLFLPVAGSGSLEKLAQDQAADEIFLALLAQFEGQGRNVSDKPTSNGYAPAMFSKEPAAKGFRKTALADAMRRLFTANRIHVAHYGRPSRPYAKLAIGPSLSTAQHHET